MLMPMQLSFRRLAGAFIVLLTGFPVQAAPPVQSWWLDNGARVLFIETNQLPMVDIRVVFNAGSARDGDHAGVARLTNALMSEGADGMSADAVSLGFDRLGAQFDSDSLQDMSIFSLRSLVEPKTLDKAVALMAAVLAKPDFPSGAFERLRKQMLAGLEAESQSPSRILRREFLKALYGDHPYGIPAQGTEASLKAMTLDAVREFYTRHMVGRNATVAIVGDVDMIRASRLAEAVTAGLDAGEAVPELPPVKPLTEARTIRIHHPTTQSHIMVGQPGVARADQDLFSLYVGNHIFGGSGLVSMLSDEIREKRGLSYSVGSQFVAMQAPGPFRISLQTKNDQVDEALNVIKESLTGFVAKGPSEEQMEAAIDNIGGSFPLGIASNAGLVSYLGVIGFYDLPLDYLELYVPRIVAETRETVTATFQERVFPERMLTVIVGGGQPTAATAESGSAIEVAHQAE